MASPNQFRILISFIFFTLLVHNSLQQPQQQQPNGTASCSNNYRFSPGSELGKNIQTVLANLLQEAPATGYKSSSQGTADTAYGLLQCRGDISSEQCRSCAADAIRSVNDTCVIRNTTKGGRALFDSCFLRYEDHFFSSILDTESNQRFCYSSDSSNTAAFGSNSELLLEFLRIRVPASDRRFVAAVAGLGSSGAAYGLGQCIPDLSATDCVACLGAARNVLSSCSSNNTGGACYFSSCTLHVQGSKFFQGAAETAALGSSKGKKSRNIGLIVGLPIAAAVLLLGLLLGFLLFRRRRRKNKEPKLIGDELTELQTALNRGPVTFSYELLRGATQDFSDVHKLGEGGFGAVYKGTFGDGTELAIKKLSVASKQGEQQFLNEVKVISSVQHRNLVKLLGCCVHGTERLLVYEFLKNNSLERALFGSDQDKPPLSWQMRYNILMGTARGLTYLHEDSQIRIVHRDIKPSNILLDEVYDAKIADFGLARLYGEDETSEIITTKVAGTYGYMAPEYAFHGHLSEKADVFSFGILMLETVAGRKNRDVTLPGPEQYLLEWAWQQHGDGLLETLLDPALLVAEENNELSRKALVEAIHIALMCTQASPQSRPSMSHIVAMLSGHSNVHVPLADSFDSSLLRPAALFSHATTSSSASAASNDSRQKQQQQHLSDTFTQPLPR